ncbi:hypothetical protein OUZ56_001928 [Daphnia magna]|uniref:Uncharacterized protein n=1 Tax=Daphnia magna TaxID=35525 RepID=A0ABR0A4M9_9CRUS|nr:hypothetical protein OUZ56_001928 [Daphnia magna]
MESRKSPVFLYSHHFVARTRYFAQTQRIFDGVPVVSATANREETQPTKSRLQHRFETNKMLTCLSMAFESSYCYTARLNDEDKWPAKHKRTPVKVHRGEETFNTVLTLALMDIRPLPWVNYTWKMVGGESNEKEGRKGESVGPRYGRDPDRRKKVEPQNFNCVMLIHASIFFFPSSVEDKRIQLHN